MPWLALEAGRCIVKMNLGESIKKQVLSIPGEFSMLLKSPPLEVFATHCVSEGAWSVVMGTGLAMGELWDPAVIVAPPDPLVPFSL